jgi:hypothetical protein
VILDFRHTSTHTRFRAMRSRPSHPAKKDSGEYDNFEAALKSVLSVSHSEIKSKISAVKRKRVKKSSASRVANE